MPRNETDKDKVMEIISDNDWPWDSYGPLNNGSYGDAVRIGMKIWEAAVQEGRKLENKRWIKAKMVGESIGHAVAYSNGYDAGITAGLHKWGEENKRFMLYALRTLYTEVRTYLKHHPMPVDTSDEFKAQSQDDLTMALSIVDGEWPSSPFHKGEIVEFIRDKKVH